MTAAVEWRRTTIMGALDIDGLLRAWRSGWRPVPPERLPTLTASFIQGMLVRGNLVLMEQIERPQLRGRVPRAFSHLLVEICKALADPSRPIPEGPLDFPNIVGALAEVR